MTAETMVQNNTSSPGTSETSLHPGLETTRQNGTSVTLRDSVEIAIENYLEQLGDAPVTEVYQLVLSEVEAPLLEQVMQYTRNNQTKASNMLGLNRGTLRKKLKQYGLL